MKYMKKPEEAHFKDSIKFLDRVIKKDPYELAAYGLKFTALDGLGKHEEAISCMCEGIERARDLVKQNKMPELEFNGMAKEAFDYLQRDAIKLRDAGRTEEALERYKDTARMDPENSSIQMKVGNTLEELDRHKEAEKIYDMVTKLRPRNAQEHASRAEALELVERFGEAKAAYDLTLKAIPKKERNFKNTDYVDALTGKARSLYCMDRNDEALPILNDIVKNASECASAHTGIGAIMQSKGKMDEAITSFDIAIKMQPKNIIAIYGKAESLAIMGKNGEAVKYYDKMMRIGGADAQILFKKATIYLKEGKRDECKRLLDEAIRVDSECRGAIMYKAKLAEEDYRDTGDDKELRAAQNGMEKMAQILRDEPKIISMAGMLFSESADTAKKALEHFERAQKLAPLSSICIHRKGIALMNLGRDTEAYECLRKVPDDDPAFAGIQYTMGVIAEVTGRLSMAEMHIRKAIGKEPGFKEAADALKRISKLRKK